MHGTPETFILTKDEYGYEGKNKCNYHSVIGQINYLAVTNRPNIIFAVHQCANHNIDTKQPHGESVKRIGRYLKKTKR